MSDHLAVYSSWIMACLVVLSTIIMGEQPPYNIGSYRCIRCELSPCSDFYINLCSFLQKKQTMVAARLPL